MLISCLYINNVVTLYGVNCLCMYNKCQKDSLTQNIYDKIITNREEMDELKRILLLQKLKSIENKKMTINYINFNQIFPN